MKAKRYDNQQRPSEIDLKVESPRALKTFRVSCRRRTTAGRMTVDVEAVTADDAMQQIRDGTARPGVGLGWIPTGAVDITDAE